MVISNQVVAELRRRSEEIAHTLTLESGKPIKDSKGEVARSIDTFQAAAEESVRIYGEHMPLDISARNKGLQVLDSQISQCHASMGGWEFAIIGTVSCYYINFASYCYHVARAMGIPLRFGSRLSGGMSRWIREAYYGIDSMKMARISG